MSEDAPIQLKAKIQRWHRHNKVNGTLMPAKNMAPALGYKAMQWGTGPSGNGSATARTHNNNRVSGFHN